MKFEPASTSTLSAATTVMPSTVTAARRDVQAAMARAPTPAAISTGTSAEPSSEFHNPCSEPLVVWCTAGPAVACSEYSGLPKNTHSMPTHSSSGQIASARVPSQRPGASGRPARHQRNAP